MRPPPDGQSPRDAQALQAFQDRYHSTERRDFRQRIRNGEFGPAELFDRKNLSEEDNALFGILIDELEFLAILVDRELLDFGLVVSAFRNTPAQIWRYLEPSIRAHRQNAPDPILGIHLEKLAQRYDEHYRKNFGIPHPAFAEPGYGAAPPAPRASGPGAGPTGVDPGGLGERHVDVLVILGKALAAIRRDDWGAKPTQPRRSTSEPAIPVSARFGTPFAVLLQLFGIR